MRSYADILAPKCGGQLRVPTFINVETKRRHCGEIAYEAQGLGLKQPRAVARLTSAEAMLIERFDPLKGERLQILDPDGRVRARTSSRPCRRRPADASTT